MKIMHLMLKIMVDYMNAREYNVSSKEKPGYIHIHIYTYT